MKIIIIVAGTRPEVIKLFPVYIALKKKREFKTLWVSTGQHKEMLIDLYSFFSFKPDFDFEIMVRDQSLSTLSQILLKECSELFQKLHPECIIVQGDTNSALVASLAAFYLGHRIVHVEAGLRSYNNCSPYPEEGNRRMISMLADVNFAPTRRARQTLLSERVPGRTVQVGNTVIDSLFLAAKSVKRNERQGKYSPWKAMMAPFSKMILITGHRRENFGVGFKSICRAIKKLSIRNPSCCFVFPVHLNPNVRLPVFETLKGNFNVFLTDPVSYDVMIFLMQSSYLILTDSGGIQEEAPSFGKPVLIMRDNTERPEGVEVGCSKLVGVTERKIVANVELLLQEPREYREMTRKRNPYGDGQSAARIADYLERYISKIL